MNCEKHVKLSILLVIGLLVFMLTEAGNLEPPGPPAPTMVTLDELNAASSRPFQLVGFTTATFQGNAGFFGFSEACEAEFPSSRMCFLEEALKTTQIPDLSSEQALAWIDPGAFFANNVSASCQGWSNGTSGAGLTLSKIGEYPTRSCENFHSVACCSQ